MSKAISSFSEKANRSTLIKALPNKILVPKADWDSYYMHLTLHVQSLVEYVDVVQRLTEIVKKMDEDRLVFRGHSDASSNYKLVPSIGRKVCFIEGTENNLITEMITLRPEEFVGIDSNFDLLSKMQHFGIPTRILDFTCNPLIALYFACSENFNYDGRVVCTYDTSSAFTAKTIESICGMYKFLDYNAISLDELVGGVSYLEKYAGDTLNPLMAKPKYSNDRIRHQAAMFMVFPNLVVDLRSKMVVMGKKCGDENEYRFFTISENDKRRLDLVREEQNFYDETFSVNSSTLKSLFAYYEKKYVDFRNAEDDLINPDYYYLFKDRFSIRDGIQQIPQEYLQNSFVSIIVNTKNKKNILKELASFGIDKAYVYPELEYTAEMVRNKFFN